MKSNLLILFGEYRTFEICIHQLQRLDEFDVIFSTWDFSSHADTFQNNPISIIKKNITESDIVKYIPHCVPIISKYNTSYTHGTSNMVYHWKTSLNTIDYLNYDKIILHRSDMISNFHKLLDVEFQNNILYSEPGHYIDDTTDWYNDYIFAGKSDIVVKFINSFESIEYKQPHSSIANVINCNNIKTKNIKHIHPHYESYIIRNWHSNLITQMNINGINYFEIPLKKRPVITYH